MSEKATFSKMGLISGGTQFAKKRYEQEFRWAPGHGN